MNIYFNKNSWPKTPVTSCSYTLNTTLLIPPPHVFKNFGKILCPTKRQTPPYPPQESYRRKVYCVQVGIGLQQTSQYWQFAFLQENMYQTRDESVILLGLDISRPYLVIFKWQELPPAALLPFENNKVLKLGLSCCFIICHGP